MTDYSSEDFWKGAPEGATHYFAPFFYKADGPRAWLFSDQWRLSSYSTRQIDESGVKRPAPPWSGDGRPPVGTRCEVLNNDLSNAEWEQCTILFSGKHRIVYDSESCSERVGYRDCLQFRPIKTTAQIAAEEREAAIKEIGNIIASVGPTFRDQAVRLFDAGYRKGDDK